MKWCETIHTLEDFEMWWTAYFYGGLVPLSISKPMSFNDSFEDFREIFIADVNAMMKNAKRIVKKDKNDLILIINQCYKVISVEDDDLELFKKNQQPSAPLFIWAKKKKYEVLVKYYMKPIDDFIQTLFQVAIKLNHLYFKDSDV
jgi:hypothetical protein